MCFVRLQDAPDRVPAPLLDQVTLPVGAEEPDPRTVALHVTVEPTTTVEWLQERVRVIGEALTVIVMHPLVAPLWFESPLKTAFQL